MDIYQLPVGELKPTLALAPLVIAGIIAAVGAIANSVIQSSSSKKQAKMVNSQNIALQDKANQQNLELSKYQFDQNKEMYRIQNEYNSPVSQMGRYNAAGLNPNLIYGQGSSGNASGAPSFEAPRFQAAQVGARFTPFQIPEMLGMYQDMAMKQAQIQNVEAQTARTTEQTRTEAINRMVAAITGQRKQFDLDLASELRRYTVESAGSRAASSTTGAAAQAEQLKLLMQFGAREHEAGIAGRGAATALAKIQTATAGEKLALLKQFGWSEGYQKQVMADKAIEAQGLENFFKQYRNDFAKYGVNTSDNFLVRMLYKMFTMSGLPDIGSGETLK